MMLCKLKLIMLGSIRVIINNRLINRLSNLKYQRREGMHMQQLMLIRVR